MGQNGDPSAIFILLPNGARHFFVACGSFGPARPYLGFAALQILPQRLGKALGARLLRPIFISLAPRHGCHKTGRKGCGKRPAAILAPQGRVVALSAAPDGALSAAVAQW
jgi:hypothetical protein